MSHINQIVDIIKLWRYNPCCCINLINFYSDLNKLGRCGREKNVGKMDFINVCVVNLIISSYDDLSRIRISPIN